MNTKHLVSLGLVFAALGCATPEGGTPLENDLPNVEGERAWLVAKVERPTGSVIEFYEMSPGILVVSEVGTGEPTFTPEELETMSTAELYAAIAPTAEMPAHLADAVDREAELLATGVTPERQGVPPQLEPTDVDTLAPPVASTQASTGMQAKFCRADWFRKTFCSSNSQYKRCATDRTSSRLHTLNGIQRHTSVVCTREGNPMFAMQSRHELAWWWTHEVWHVPAGYWRYWSHVDNSWDHDVKASVSIATSNDHFHYSHYGNW